MAKKKDEEHNIQLVFSYDRLSEHKLLQAYGILVPERLKALNKKQINSEKGDTGNPIQDENSSDILSCFVGQAKRRANNC